MLIQLHFILYRLLIERTHITHVYSPNIQSLVNEHLWPPNQKKAKAWNFACLIQRGPH
jgi:hypothetical protein